MEELNPSARFSWRDLLRPGCLVGLTGVAVIALSVFKIAWSNHNVDLATNPEMAAGGGTVKMMVWLVIGIGLSLLGALLSYVEYSRR
jgi:hypothetical protein